MKIRNFPGCLLACDVYPVGRALIRTIQLVLTNLKSETRREEHVLAFEQLAPVSPDHPFAPIQTVLGDVPQHSAACVSGLGRRVQG